MVGGGGGSAVCSCSCAVRRFDSRAVWYDHAARHHAPETLQLTITTLYHIFFLGATRTHPYSRSTMNMWCTQKHSTRAREPQRLHQCTAACNARAALRHVARVHQSPRRPFLNLRATRRRSFAMFVLAFTSAEHVVQTPRAGRSSGRTRGGCDSSARACSPASPWNRLVRRVDDAVGRWAVLLPERRWQLGRVVLEAWGRPLLKWGQRDALRLC